MRSTLCYVLLTGAKRWNINRHFSRVASAVVMKDSKYNAEKQKLTSCELVLMYYK